jgi:hypothetical protein
VSATPLNTTTRHVEIAAKAEKERKEEAEAAAAAHEAEGTICAALVYACVWPWTDLAVWCSQAGRA